MDELEVVAVVEFVGGESAVFAARLEEGDWVHEGPGELESVVLGEGKIVRHFEGSKAGTDVGALTNAVREFLHDRFGDHKFMLGIHTDKEAEGHIHAHAVIAVKNENGQKIHPNREDFRTHPGEDAGKGLAGEAARM